MSTKLSPKDQNFHQKSSYKNIHFFLTQIPVLLVLEVVSGVMYVKCSNKFVMSFYCLPAIIIYFFFLYKCGWGGDWRQIHRRFFFTMIGTFIFLPVFFSVYFLVWNPTLQIQWYKSTACRPVGQSVTFLGNLERYGLQYVYINSDIVGLSCISNRISDGNQMKSYDFYERGDYYSCDSNYDPYERSQVNYYKEQNQQNSGKNSTLGRKLLSDRFLADDEDGIYLNDKDQSFGIYEDEQDKNIRALQNITDSNSDSSTNGNKKTTAQTTRKSGLSKRCRTQYVFSEVKIPSWLCQNVEENNRLVQQVSKDISYEQPCYYAYYGEKDKARENGRGYPHDDLKLQSDFVMVRMEEEMYYFKEGFICLIIFAMFPSVIFSLQAPISLILYKAMLLYYADNIFQENLQFMGKYIQEIPSSKGIEETSQSERDKQKLEPHDIVQILSPNSLQKDRDFYDIYNNTRRKQLTQITNQNQNVTVIVNTEDPINVTKFNEDSSKVEMVSKQKNGSARKAQSIDQMEEKLRASLNGPRNVSQKNDSESSSEDEQKAQNSSYFQIRNIYKKKLNPTYQKEAKKKIKEGIQIENEEAKVIKEIKQQQLTYQEKQRVKKQRNNQRENESPTLDSTIQYQNDYSNILDASTMVPPPIGQSDSGNNNDHHDNSGDAQNVSVYQNHQDIFLQFKISGENCKNDNDNTINLNVQQNSQDAAKEIQNPDVKNKEVVQDQQSQTVKERQNNGQEEIVSNDNPFSNMEQAEDNNEQIEKLQEAYEIYADQLNKMEKVISSPPQETEFIQQ